MLEVLRNLDGNVLLWIQEVLRGPVSSAFFSVYTVLGDLGLAWIALSAVMLLFRRTRKAGVLGLCALLLGALCTNCILKPLIARDRPWLVVEGLVPLVVEHDPNSFPSGHTSAAFAAACAWARALPWRWMRVTGVVLAALMGFSRLFVGVHFPSDVLAGALVGFLCSVVVWLVWRRVAIARNLEP